MRPMVKIHNVETDEITEREMNDVEFSQYELDQIEVEADRKAKEELAKAKTSALAKLAALGLSADEIAAL